MIGLMLIIGSTVLLSSTCPQLACAADTPAWLYVLCAVCLFSYWILGKHGNPYPPLPPAGCGV
jgi:hypothetical protein